MIRAKSAEKERPEWRSEFDRFRTGYLRMKIIV